MTDKVEEAGRRLLRDVSRPVARWSAAAAVAAAARGLATIGFCWLVAGALSGLVLPRPGQSPLSRLLIGIAGLAVLRALLPVLSQHLAAHASQAARAALFGRLLGQIEALGPARLAGRSTGDLVTRLTDGVDALDPYWRRYAPAAALAAAQPAAALVVVAPLDWISAAILAGSLPLLVGAMILAGVTAQSAADRQWRTLTRLGGQLLDAIQGLTEIALFNAARREAAAVRRAAQAYARETMAVLRLAFLSALALEFFATVAIALLAISIGFRLMWGEMDFRIGLFVLMVAPEVYAPMRALGAERHARMEALAAAEGLADLLDPPAPEAGAGKLASGAPATIRFEHVSYARAGFALQDINLEIRAGERLAIVGPSGAGKSTLLALLTGFLDPTCGRILIDGAPLAEVDLADWRRRIAYLPQRAHVFDAEIADNIALGRPGAGADPIGAALAAAGLDRVIAALPEGRRTRLAENGKGLSGGEIQRLALARAFYGGGAAIVADEPTAHLDAAVEAALLKRLDVFARGRTLIMVAHRRASLGIVDRIVTLKDGRIVSQALVREAAL
ncbi:MAG TPA: thiol reductant ABC exporter subunit CydD [Roseiarcus sp.]|nr:thiol reductant ABC exporter subunit CydD [Roseiarcus sp.]